MIGKSIFITGASGFVGRHLVRRIDPSRVKILCLSRSLRAEGTPSASPGPPKVLRGSLFDIGNYERELANADAVIHLAGATGKNRPEEYFRVNTEGTRFLVEQCRRLGVPRFLHVSSIAVRFPEKRHYYYAQSKEQAEAVVRAGAARYTIIRPTIILGRGSPAWMGFLKLASFPIIPIFGDGKTSIQPIEVEDLADCLLAILERERFENETLELGGPQIISIEAFLKKVCWLRHRRTPRIAHIPLSPVLSLLTLLEKPFHGLLPMTAGQLYSFLYDGTIETNDFFEERVAHLKTLDEMLASLCSDDTC